MSSFAKKARDKNTINFAGFFFFFRLTVEEGLGYGREEEEKEEEKKKHALSTVMLQVAARTN